MSAVEKTWTDNQLADYECALETIGNAIALKAKDIAEEKAKTHPDNARLETLRSEQAELANERSRLRLEDSEAIARVIAQHGQAVRSRI